MAKSMGVEYNTAKGLDWARIRSEFEAASSPQDLVHEAAAAKAIQRGKTMADAKQAGVDAVAKAFPELAKAKPTLRVVEAEPDPDDEDAA